MYNEEWAIKTFKTNKKNCLMLYYRHGQSAARGPHAAVQTFLWPLSFKYTIPHSHLFRKILLFKPKYDIFDEHFRNLKRNFQNNYVPLHPPRYLSYVWNELAALRTFKISENGSWLKKSGHPCYITSTEQVGKFQITVLYPV